MQMSRVNRENGYLALSKLIFVFVYTFHSTFDAHDTHSLRHDEMNELKVNV